MNRFLLLGLLSISGCVSAPPAVDPFAGLRSGAPTNSAAYKDLTVAVFVSQNTQNTIAYARSYAVRRSRGSFGPKVESYIGQLASEFIPKQFKSAVKIERMEDAASVHADAVAVLDVRAEGGIRAWQFTTVDVSLIFMTPGGEQLDVVKGSGKDKIHFPDVPSAFDAAVVSALAQTQRSLEDALYKSGPLLSLARTKGNGGPAEAARPASATAAAAAPAPPAKPASDVDVLPASAAKPDPKAYGIVIGIERYREHLPAADFAAEDARLAAEYLKRVLGVPEENLALLVDDRAAKGDFEKYFERWLPNHVESGGKVYVYYSGHGAPNPRTGDAYMVPFDADPTYIDQTGYSIKRMYAQLAKLPAAKTTVVMDSCFSGAGGRSVIAQGARPLVTVADGVVPPGVTVISASAGDQISNSYREKGHGLFTYFFLKGLKSKGSDLRGVFDYLKPEVARVARRQYNADQDAQWRVGR